MDGKQQAWGKCPFRRTYHQKNLNPTFQSESPVTLLEMLIPLLKHNPTNYIIYLQSHQHSPHHFTLHSSFKLSNICCPVHALKKTHPFTINLPVPIYSANKYLSTWSDEIAKLPRICECTCYWHVLYLSALNFLSLSWRHFHLLSPLRQNNHFSL